MLPMAHTWGHSAGKTLFWGQEARSQPWEKRSWKRSALLLEGHRLQPPEQLEITGSFTTLCFKDKPQPPR